MTLIERLLIAANKEANELADLLLEAAHEIERLTTELARAKEYHAAELADVTAELECVVAQRDSLQAQLTDIWI